MTEKIIEQRTCIACRTKKHKSQLVRCVRLSTGAEIDREQKAQGRGAYVCFDPQCIAKVKKKHLLNRALKITATSDFYDRLEEVIAP